MVIVMNLRVGWAPKCCVWSVPFGGVECCGIERGSAKKYVSSPSRYAISTWLDVEVQLRILILDLLD